MTHGRNDLGSLGQILFATVLVAGSAILIVGVLLLGLDETAQGVLVLAFTLIPLSWIIARFGVFSLATATLVGWMGLAVAAVFVLAPL